MLRSEAPKQPPAVVAVLVAVLICVSVFAVMNFVSESTAPVVPYLKVDFHDPLNIAANAIALLGGIIIGFRITSNFAGRILMCTVMGLLLSITVNAVYVFQSESMHTRLAKYMDNYEESHTPKIFTKHDTTDTMPPDDLLSESKNLMDGNTSSGMLR